MVRVGNTGISAVITPVGRIKYATALFTRTTEIETVQWKNIHALYTRTGNLFAWICCALLILGLMAATVTGFLRDKSSD